MKVWYGYGTEHSMNLVMIGHFKSPNDAEETNELITKITKAVDGKIEVGRNYSRYDNDMMGILREVNSYILSPSELEQFLYDTTIQVDGDKLILTTEETEISAFSS